MEKEEKFEKMGRGRTGGRGFGRIAGGVGARTQEDSRQR